MAENQFIWACRYDQDKMLMFRLNVRMVKKCDLRHSECGTVTVARWAALSNSIAASLLGFSHTTVSMVYRERFYKPKNSGTARWTESTISEVLLVYHPFITTLYPSSDHCFQEDKVSCHNVQMISNWFLEVNSLYSDGLQQDLSNLGAGGTGKHRLCYHYTIMSVWTKIEYFQCYDKLKQFWRQTGA